MDIQHIGLLPKNSHWHMEIVKQSTIYCVINIDL